MPDRDGMAANPDRPEHDGLAEVAMRCRDLVGVVEYDADGIPIVLRRRCRNRECCPRKEGMMALHHFTLHGVHNGKGVSEFITSYAPTRTVSEFLADMERFGIAGEIPAERTR